MRNRMLAKSIFRGKMCVHICIRNLVWYLIHTKYITLLSLCIARADTHDTSHSSGSCIYVSHCGKPSGSWLESPVHGHARPILRAVVLRIGRNCPRTRRDYPRTGRSRNKLRMFCSWDRTGFFLTHWGRDKIAAIFQTRVSNAFSSMKMFEFRLKFHWSLFLRVQSTISQHWFR